MPWGGSRARARRLPEAPQCRRRRPGGSAREPCNPRRAPGCSVLAQLPGQRGSGATMKKQFNRMRQLANQTVGR